MLRCLPVGLALVAALVSANPQVIYPTPREIIPGNASVTFDRSAQLSFIAAEDAPTLAVLQTVIAQAPAGTSRLALRVGWRGQPGVDALLAGVPQVSGAYRLKVSREGITLAGHDARGVYYAAQTLQRLAVAGKLSELTVTDWPEVAFRGVVEGFYGTPWSHQRRLSLIRYLGEVKLNTYIYGPKDDPYHSSPNWRKPYPPADEARIRELVAACRAHHVDFVWAIHPGKDIRWTDEDFAAVLAKFEAMHALGVRAFSVFFDDISGEGTKADQQARLLNFLHERFVKAKGDVLPLVMCPTQYNRSWSGGDYLDVLGKTLDPSIHVMWTGDRVVADLDRQAMDWINQRLRRKAYIWWNFPVSDYVRNHLLLGPTYGNANDIGSLYGGFVSNPMERSEASKVALFGVADYTWNPRAYQPDAAWRAGIRYVVPAAAEAYETFSAHNSDLGPNGHGYRREESVAFTKTAESFLADLRAERPLQPREVRAELVRIASASAAIRAGLANPLLLEEIEPWLDAFEQLGRQGVAALDALAALDKGETAQAWSLLNQALEAAALRESIDRTRNRNPYQPGIRTGTKVVLPLVNEMTQTVNHRLIMALGGRPPLRLRPFASAEGFENLDRMTDGKETTLAYWRRIQVAGDTLGVDLGGLQIVQRVRVVQGRHDGDHDKVHQGVLEGLAADGKWRELAQVTTERVDVTLKVPTSYRQLRLRVVRAGVPGGKPDVWTAIREFEVNPVDAAQMRSTVAGLRGLPVRLADGVYSMSPGYEVHPFPAGAQVGMLLPTTAEVLEVEVDLGTAPVGLVVETSPEGNTWKTAEAKTEGTRLKVKVGSEQLALRVRHAGTATLQVTPKTFVVRTKPRPPTPQEHVRDGTALTFAELKAGTVLEIPLTASEVPSAKGLRSVTLLASSGTPSGDVRVAGKVVPLTFSKGLLPSAKLPAGAEVLLLRASGDAALKVHEVVVK